MLRFAAWKVITAKRAKITTQGLMQLRKSSVNTIAEVISALQTQPQKFAGPLNLAAQVYKKRLQDMTREHRSR